MTTVSVSTANWVIARSGAPSSAYITATPYPTVPSDKTAAMLERANAADSAPATMSAASSAFVELRSASSGAAAEGRGRSPARSPPAQSPSTTTVSTYERSDALCSAGATRRLSASRPASVNEYRRSACSAAGHAKPPESSARREQTDRTSERQRAQQQASR